MGGLNFAIQLCCKSENDHGLNVGMAASPTIANLPTIQHIDMIRGQPQQTTTIDTMVVLRGSILDILPLDRH